MKKIILIAIVLAFAISLTACVSRSDDSSKEQESQSSSSEEQSSQSSDNSQSSKPTDTTIEDVPVASEEEIQEILPPNLEKISALDPANVPWGPGVQKDKEGRPTACVGLQEKYTKFSAHFIAPKEKKIYLTFDEGYENGNSAAILDVLKDKEVSAVFFVTREYAKANPDLIKRMIDEGHIVGNHSAGHPNYTKVTVEKAMKATTDLHQYMLDEYDYKMNLFRFPEGAFSEQTLALVQALGYDTSFWSFAYMDWDPNKQMSTTDAFEKITKNTHEGAIYLLHAVSKTNAEILGDVIDFWREGGYEVAKYDINYGDKVDLPIRLTKEEAVLASQSSVEVSSQTSDSSVPTDETSSETSTESSSEK
ncbi:MAG: polysaccharide deacetylase family protein [Oscillospiraceae bacterium]